MLLLLLGLAFQYSKLCDPETNIKHYLGMLQYFSGYF